MSERHILIAEDDGAIRGGLRDALDISGYRVHEASHGEAALKKALSLTLDLVVLDLVMPRQHGLDVLSAIRKERPGLPVIILTAMGGEADRVAGLTLGADDYVVKPFSVRELLARIEAVLRRSAERPKGIPIGDTRIAGGSIRLSESTIVFDDGTRTELSERESEVLGYLARHVGRIISRDELLEKIWRVDPRRFETRTVDVCIGRIRAKLRDDPAEPRVLFTVRGRGYRFVGESAS